MKLLWMWWTVIVCLWSSRYTFTWTIITWKILDNPLLSTQIFFLIPIIWTIWNCNSNILPDIIAIKKYNYILTYNVLNTLPKGALMVEVCTGTMVLKNDQQYGCQTGNNSKDSKEKSRDLNRNSSFSNKNETMFGSGYENFRSLECYVVLFLSLIFCKQEDCCSPGAF